VRISDIPEIARLSTPEKILLVEDLWDSIASDESSVPVPQSHMEELDRRLKSMSLPAMHGTKRRHPLWARNSLGF